MSLVDYVGDWHKHPARFDMPSEQDRETARQIVTDASWDRIEAVFPIAIVDGTRIRLRAFLMYRHGSNFIEIPVEVVSDRDPRVLYVLTGCSTQSSDS